jgi:uncharacterized SAM-binding protein YcdF (DUF218 family)
VAEKSQTRHISRLDSERCPTPFFPEAARSLGAREIVVVTSRLHAFRARTLVRAALTEPGVTIETSSPLDQPSAAHLVRELVCLAALPSHLILLRAGRAAG